MTRSPDWVRDGLAQLRGELLLFVRTLGSFVAHPRRFTRGWLAGEVHALNPFGYLFTAIGFVSGVQLVASAIHARPGSEASFVAQAAGAVLPPLYYLGLGLVTHVVLWLLGSRRALLRETAAITLYASGPTFVAHAAIVILLGPLERVAESPAGGPVIGVLAIGSVLGFAIPFVAALRELHDARRAPFARAIVAFLTAFVIAGFFFGTVDPPGEYGVHLVIRPPRVKGRGWSVYFGHRLQ